jgi:outer membrane protein
MVETLIFDFKNMAMYKKITLLIGFYLVLSNSGYTQNNLNITYSLNDCIRIAIENNLDLKTTALEAESSEIFYKQAKNDQIPNLNANYNIGTNNGRNIDPFTNNYVNEKFTFSNVGLNLDIAVFNGLRIRNSIKQSRFNLEASEMEIEEAIQDLTIEVTFRYIQILNGKDQLDLSIARAETTKGQLDRLKAHYDQGIGNPADYSDMLGQYTRDEIRIINERNALKEAVLDLLRLLSTDPEKDIAFVDIEGLVESEKYKLTANEVYEDALVNLATFKAKRLRIDAADSGVKEAKSYYYPELSVFGQLNTNYSSVAEVFTTTGSVVSETGDFVNINNQTFPVLTNETLFEAQSIGYQDQFNNNFSSVIGVSLRIPILNGFYAKNRVALQKIQLKESTIELQNTEILFKRSIEEAYIKMESAFDRHDILLDQVAAYEQSFHVNEIRFNNGVSNIVEYLISKNNLDIAKLDLAKARYEYILRVRILDYYRGI